MANKSVIGFADNLVPLIKDGSKTLTYRLGDKYNFLNVGDIIETKNSLTGEVFGILHIKEKSFTRFKDLPIDRKGHETYVDRDELKMTFEKYYPGRVEDDSRIIVLGFEFRVS